MQNKLTLVIPCYNEAERLPFSDIAEFMGKHPEVHFCFVNDGSTDQTLQKLSDFENSHPLSVSIISLKQNCGKAEAVRQGILSLELRRSSVPEYIGFWDADMATPLSESINILHLLERNSTIEVVIGSRWPRLGARIDRTPIRGFVGRVMVFLFSHYLGFKIYDSQCGAKIFKRELGYKLFQDKFISHWLLDVELFRRMIMLYSKEYTIKHILEYPLLEWRDVSGSKLKFYHFGQVMLEFLKIAWFYKRRVKVKVLSETNKELEYLV